MKKFKIVFYLLLVAVLGSCEMPTHQEIAKEDSKVVIIDGCEYIIMTIGRQGFMAHKGNCGNCN